MLSPYAQKLIHDYFNLPFAKQDGVRCPYFNNSRVGQRGQLRVLIGKGTPKEIVEEAKIVSIQYCKGVFDVNGMCCIHSAQDDHSEADCLRQFLIDNNLGIDCSGFITHVLGAHLKETCDVNLSQKLLKIPGYRIIKRIVSLLRPVENINVGIYAKSPDTEEIKISEAKPGDVIVMLETGPRNERNHMLLVTDNTNGEIKYVHARAWSSEGKYGHGVAEGTIKINEPASGLLKQQWIEKNKTGEENETYLEAKNARLLQVRRIKV